MDILSALKSEASKLQQQLNTLNSAVIVLGGKNSVSRGNGLRKKRHFSAASKAKMGTVATGEVGTNKGREEECLTPPLVALKLTSVSDSSAV